MNNKPISQEVHLFCAFCKKIPTAMRMTLLFLFAALFQLQANNSYSQNTKISLDIKNSSIEKILQTIEEKSEFYFLYNSKLIDVDRKVNIRVNNASIITILEEIFKSENVVIEVEGSQIILAPKVINNKKTAVTKVLLQQEKRITGTVVDADGIPIIGANIIEEGTTNGTVTDIDGRFSLNVDNNASIHVSYIGYLEQNIALAGKNNIEIILLEDNKTLDELVVVGYGTMKKGNITGSVSVIDFDKMSESRPMINISQGLAGEAPGVFVTQSSGKPNNDTGDILIRGQGTLNNSSPLVVVDGIVGSLSDVNPNDVASVTVLKDAASASIYGSRAAGGVILVTTKRGNSSQTKVSYTLYSGLETPSLDRDMMIWDYATHMGMINNAHDNVGSGLPFSQNDIDDYLNQTNSGADPILYPNTNWFDYTLKNAFVQEHNISVSGGNEKVRYLISASSYYNEGSMKDTDFNKYSFRTNLDAELSSWLSVGTNIYGNFSHENGLNANSLYGDLVKSTPGIYPVHPDGRIGGQQVKGEVDISTIAYNTETNKRWREDQRVNGTIFSKIKFNDNLNLNLSYAVKLNNTYSKHKNTAFDIWNFKNDEIAKPSSGNSSVKDIYDRYVNYIGDAYLTYINTFNNVHNVNGMLGYNQEYGKDDGFDAKRTNLLSFDTDVLNAASGENPEVGGGYKDRSTKSVFGRANYNFKEIYYIESNFRYDGSSKFAKEHRWGLFPSVSAGWRISEENFLKDVAFLDNLKLRASLGQLGNNRIDDYGYQSLYKQVLYSFGDKTVQGAAPKENVNSLIRWETTTTSDLGLDALFFKYRLSLEATYFNKRTDDILLRIPIPLVNGGFSDPYQNAGVVTNKGYEVDLGWKDNFRRFNYGVSLNLTYVESLVNKFRGDVASYSGNKILKEGLPLYPYYVREVVGIATQEIIDEMESGGYTFNPKISPGDFLYKDQQKEGEEGYKRIDDDDRVVKGSSLPKYLFGASFNLGYKGFDFSVLLQGVSGIDTYYENSWYTTDIRNGVLINKFATNAWTPTNTNTTIPRLTTSSNANTVANDYWLRDASYLRVKSLILGYTFPESLTKKINIDRIRLFASGDNLLTFTSFPGFDPELPSASYPMMKKVSFGLNITL